MQCVRGDLALFSTAQSQRLKHARGTYRTYKGHVEALKEQFAGMKLSAVDVGAVKVLRRGLSASLRPRTVETRLGVLRLVLLDAREEGILRITPFDAPRRKRRTKRQRAATTTRRLTFQPLSASELEALAGVLREPRTEDEKRLFPLTEALLFTGLRWAEPAAWLWTDVAQGGRAIQVLRALPKHGVLSLETARGKDAPPPKNGHTWTVPVRAPLADVLFRQRQVSYVGRADSWVFPSSKGTRVREGALPSAPPTPLAYRNWLTRGWAEALKRAKVSPREGDAQKALRRTFVVSALICGRNPKEISAELGHTTPRMVLSVYDAFLDAASWPGDDERRRLARFYGWPEPAPAQSSVAASGGA